MKRIYFSVVLGVLLCAPSSALSGPPPLVGFEGHVKWSMRSWSVPGLAVAIVKDGRIVLARGFGVLTTGKKDKVDGDTLFAIASNTKAFTATALGLLVQEGQLSWDDPVTRHLPGFKLHDPEATRKITIRDLLCHRAGLGKWAGDLASYGSIYSREEVMRRIRFQKPAFAFRTSFGYTNLMFLVAGQIIPKVTRTSWDRFIARRLFRPLGMRRSNTSVKKLARLGNVATPHRLEGMRTVPIPYVNVDNHAPAGAINSSAEEMARWLLLLLDNGNYKGRRIVKPSIIAETRRSHTLIPLGKDARKLIPSRHFLTYGLGWFLSDYRGRLVVYHTGGLDGMFSYVGLMPEEKLGVVVLTNLEDHMLHKAIPYHIYDAYLGAQSRTWVWSKRYRRAHQKKVGARKRRWEARLKARKPGTRPSHPLGSYSGAYTSPVYGRATVVYKNGKLTIRMGAHPKISGALQHFQDDTFRCTWSNRSWGEELVTFDLDDRGRVERFRTRVRPDWVDTLEYAFVRQEKRKKR